jgi:hypothetical protein
MNFGYLAVSLLLILPVGEGAFAGSTWGPSETSNAPILFLPASSTAKQASFTVHGPRLRGRVLPGLVELKWEDTEVLVRFLGSQKDAQIEGTARVPDGVTRFQGGAPADRHSAFQAVVYRELYPGIDAVYDGRHGLKAEFKLQPGADASAIRIRYEGAGMPWVEAGELVVPVGSGELRELAPVAYQERGTTRIAVAAKYVVFEDGAVGFDLGKYDRTQLLVIDPLLVFSALYGGAQFDGITSVAVDAGGNSYVAGWTESPDLPVVAPLQSHYAGRIDAFVAKFSAAGQLVYATYIGGSGEDRALGVAVAADGTTFVTGQTNSPDFPTRGAFQGSLAGGRDAFLLRLNTSGDQLLFSTMFGGFGNDSGNAVAVDSSGNAYVAGATTSTNLPVLHGFQSSSGGRQDAFLAKFNPDGNLKYSTYFGGYGDDTANGVAVSGAGEAYIAGATNSPNLPIAHAARPRIAGGQDAFVAHFDTSGGLVYATYLGGSGGSAAWPEAAASVAVDTSGNAWVTGVTSSVDFPVTVGAPYTTPRGGGVDAFLVQLTTAGALAYGTYLGGSSVDYGTGVALDTAGNVFVTGYTASPDFPTAVPLQAHNAGGYDAFVVKLAPTTNTLTFATYLGGAGADSASAIATGADGTVCIGGSTLSYDFPLVNSAQTWNAGVYGGFVARLATSTGPPVSTAVTPASGTGVSQTFQFAFSDPDGAGDIQWALALVNAAISGGHACYVEYGGLHNQLFLLNDAASGWLGPLFPGVAGTVENSQCRLDGGASSVTATGTVLTVSAALTFKAAFTGTKNVYLLAIDRAGQSSAFQGMGTWQVPAAIDQAPAPVSVTPSSGSGLSRVFQFAFSDPDGAADIQWALALVNSVVASGGACYLEYDGVHNQLFLLNDAAGGWLGPLSPGVARTVENSQCRLDGGASSVTAAGTVLTVSAALTFKSAFTGTRNVYLLAIDRAGQSGGFAQLGTWRIP